MSHKSILLPVAQAALLSQIIAGSGEDPATSTSDIIWQSVTSMSCPSAMAPVILPLARCHTFSVDGASAVPAGFVLGAPFLCVVVKTIPPRVGPWGGGL